MFDGVVTTPLPSLFVATSSIKSHISFVEIVACSMALPLCKTIIQQLARIIKASFFALCTPT